MDNLNIVKYVNSREMLDIRMERESFLKEIFVGMWTELDKALAYHDIDSLPSDGSAEIRFEIMWKVIK